MLVVVVFKIQSFLKHIDELERFALDYIHWWELHVFVVIFNDFVLYAVVEEYVVN